MAIRSDFNLTPPGSPADFSLSLRKRQFGADPRRPQTGSDKLKFVEHLSKITSDFRVPMIYHLRAVTSMMDSRFHVPRPLSNS